MVALMLPWFIMLWASTVQGAWLQYRLSDRQIIGAFNVQADMHIGPGEAGVEWQPGVPASALVWPAPATCATGKMQWSLMSPGNVLPPVFNTALIMLRCQPVANLEELNAAALAEMSRLANRRALVLADLLGALGMIKAEINCTSVSGTTCVACTSANCNTVRANITTIAGWLATLPQTVTLTNEMIAIRADWQAVKTAQGW